MYHAARNPESHTFIADASLPIEVDADDFDLVDVSQEEGQEGAGDEEENPREKTEEDRVESTVEATEQQEIQDHTRGLIFEISNRNAIIAQMKGLLEAKDRENKVGVATNDGKIIPKITRGALTNCHH